MGASGGEEGAMGNKPGMKEYKEGVGAANTSSGTVQATKSPIPTCKGHSYQINNVQIICQIRFIL